MHLHVNRKGVYRGCCNKCYFTLVIGIRNWVRIYQIFERDRIPIHYLSINSNLNTEKLNVFKFILRIPFPKIIIIHINFWQKCFVLINEPVFMKQCINAQTMNDIYIERFFKAKPFHRNATRIIFFFEMVQLTKCFE